MDPAERDSALRLDDLQYKKLFLYQRKDLPRFTQDTVLLADFAELRQTDIAVDLGAGTGALALLAHARSGAKICCIEREPALCALIKKSAAHNKIELPVYETDWAYAQSVPGAGAFSAVLCNPPYFQGGTASADAVRAAARGYKNALQGAVQAAAGLLKPKGKLYICYPAAGLTELFALCRDAGMEPKKLRLVAEREQKAPYLTLMMAMKAARPGLFWLPQLYLKDAAGAETTEYKRIYHLT